MAARTIRVIETHVPVASVALLSDEELAALYAAIAAGVRDASTADDAIVKRQVQGIKDMQYLPVQPAAPTLPEAILRDALRDAAIQAIISPYDDSALVVRPAGRISVWRQQVDVQHSAQHSVQHDTQRGMQHSTKTGVTTTAAGAAAEENIGVSSLVIAWDSLGAAHARAGSVAWAHAPAAATWVARAAMHGTAKHVEFVDRALVVERAARAVALARAEAQLAAAASANIYPRRAPDTHNVALIQEKAAPLDEQDPALVEVLARLGFAAAEGDAAIDAAFGDLYTRRAIGAYADFVAGDDGPIAAIAAAGRVAGDNAYARTMRAIAQEYNDGALFVRLLTKFAPKRVAEIMQLLAQDRAVTPVQIRFPPLSPLNPTRPAIANVRASVLLALLTPTERAALQAEAQSLRAAWARRAACPHAAAVARLARAPTVAALREVESYAPPGFFTKKSRDVEPGWIICTRCGCPLICPHTRAAVLATTTRGSADPTARYKALQEAMRPFIATEAALQGGPTAEFAAAPTPEDTFCRVCGELLSVAADDDIQPSVDSPLRRELWSAALAVYRHLQFGTAMEPTAFARGAVDAVQSAADTAATAAAAGPHRTKLDTLAPLAALVARAHVYAYALQVVLLSQGTRAPVALAAHERRAKRQRIDPAAAAATMADLLIADNGNIISQIIDATREFVATKFLEAYRVVSKNAADVQLEDVDIDAVVINDLIGDLVDPAVGFAQMAAIIAGDLEVCATPTPAAARARFILLLGADPATITAPRTDLGPEFAWLTHGRGQRPGEPSAEQVMFMHRDPRVNVLRSLYEPRSKGGAARANKPAVRASKPAAVRTREKLFAANSIPLDLLSAYRLFAYRTRSVYTAAAAAQYASRLAAARADAPPPRAIVGLGDWAASQPADMRDQTFQVVPVPLTCLFDDEGRPHEWRKFVYSDGTEGTVAPPATTAVDNICRVCGAHYLDALAADAAAVMRVEEAVRKRMYVELVLKYFELRCPIDGMQHVYGTELAPADQCSKCGRDPTSEAKNPAERIAYFDKYENAYLITVRHSAVIGTKLAAPSLPKIERGVRPAWDPADLGPVVRAAELAGVPPSHILAIGTTEGRDVADADAPGAPVLSVDDARVTSAAGMALWLGGEYAELRRGILGAASWADAVREGGLPPHVLPMLIRLPELDSLVGPFMPMFRTMSDAAREAKKAAREAQKADMAEAVMSFVHGYIARAAVALSELAPPSALSPEDGAAAVKAAATFARAALLSMLKADSLWCAPGLFDFGVFGEELEMDAVEDVVIDEAIGEVDAGLTDPATDIYGDMYADMDYDGGNEEPA